MSAFKSAPKSKFARYRERQRARGLKEVRFWLPDPNAPGRREEIARQVELLRNAPDEAEVMEWVQGLWADIEKAEGAMER